jgi:hypothetical protein
MMLTLIATRLCCSSNLNCIQKGQSTLEKQNVLAMAAGLKEDDKNAIFARLGATGHMEAFEWMCTAPNGHVRLDPMAGMYMQ